MNPKNVILKLVSIAYSGKSIGNDVQIEVKVLNERINLDVTLEKGSSTQIKKKIGIFSVDRDSFQLPVLVKITEKDPLYDDVASKKIVVPIDLSLGKSQISTHQIKIKETRKYSKGSEAVLDISFEISFQEAIRYIEEMDDGFLVVLTGSRDEKQSLPAFLKVEFERRENDRDYFTVLEGIDKDKKRSVKTKSNNGSYLLLGNPYTGAVSCTYSISKKIFSIKGKEYKTIDDPREPWKKGKYDIEIPDAPHDPSRSYMSKAPKALVWFRIGHSGEKYIHTGQRTLGCITLIEHEKWDEVYGVLIRGRKGDLKSVGVLEVID